MANVSQLLGYITVGVIVLLAITPILAKLLVNNPQLREKGRFYDIAFFTYVPEGSIKAIMRGKRVVRYIMNFKNHRFAGSSSDYKGSRNFIDEWEVVPGTPEKVPLTLSPLSWIDWWAYTTTGTRFVGIWPFQEVFTYPFSRLKEIIEADGKTSLVGSTKLSDHLFASERNYHFIIKNAETQGIVPVDIHGQIIIQVVNPQKALFVAGDYLGQTLSKIRAKGRAVTRTWKIDDLLGVDQDLKEKIVEEERKVLHDQIMEIGPELEDEWGIQLVDVYIEDIEPTPKDATILDAMTAPYKERKLAQAKIEKGKGEQEFLRLKMEVIREYESSGALSLEQMQVLANSTDEQSKHIIWANNPLFSNGNGKVSSNSQNFLSILDELEVSPEELRSIIARLKGGVE